MICCLGVSTLFAAEMKVGVIDIHRILGESKQAKAAREKLEKTFKPREAKIQELQKSYKDDVAKLERDASVISASDKQKLQDKITNEGRDLQRLQRDYQQDASVAENREMKEFLQTLKKTVDNYAESQGYDIILQKDQIPYANPRNDITNEILKKLG